MNFSFRLKPLKPQCAYMCIWWTWMPLTHWRRLGRQTSDSGLSDDHRGQRSARNSHHLKVIKFMAELFMWKSVSKVYFYQCKQFSSGVFNCSFSFMCLYSHQILRGKNNQKMQSLVTCVCVKGGDNKMIKVTISTKPPSYINIVPLIHWFIC